MSQVTKIEWTDVTWNPVRGCSRVSEGCRQCYAERMAARFSGPGLWAEGIAENTPGGPRWTGRVELVPSKLAEPLSWRKPCRVFVNSMSDLFHEGLPDEAIAAVFGVMAACPQHTFQVLTKRPERMREWFGWMHQFAMDQRGWVTAPSKRQSAMKAAFTAMGETDQARRLLELHWMGDGNRGPWPLPNVWLGVSVEDQATADARIPLLLDTPAAVRFISAEPLLAFVDLLLQPRRRYYHDTLNGFIDNEYPDQPCKPTAHLDWVIVGGESGPAARPFDHIWARGLVAQCRAAGVPVFVKQLGTRQTNGGTIVTHRSAKGGDPAEWPEDLRIREFPEVA